MFCQKKDKHWEVLYVFLAKYIRKDQISKENYTITLSHLQYYVSFAFVNFHSRYK